MLRILRAVAGILLVLAYGLYPSYLVISHGRAFGQNLMLLTERVGRDKITLWEKRFDGLRRILPKNSIVGYVSDLRDDQGDVEYRQVQYTLTPVLVAERLDLPLVIGNFHSETVINAANHGEFPPDKRLILVKDYGKGVMLFRETTK